MPDSFSELKGAGGSSKPWIAAGVSALAVALILIALAGAWRSANPRPEPTSAVPETVTVTAQPQLSVDTSLPTGTFTGTLNSLEDHAKVRSWPAVAVFGGGTASVTYPLTGCTVLIEEDGTSVPLTKACSGNGSWDVETPEPGLVHLTYVENDSALVEGTLSAGLP